MYMDLSYISFKLSAVSVSYYLFVFSSLYSFQESSSGSHGCQERQVCATDLSLVSLLQILWHWSVHEEDQQQQPVQTGDRDSDLWSPPMQPKDLQQIEGKLQTLYVLIICVFLKIKFYYLLTCWSAQFETTVGSCILGIRSRPPIMGSVVWFPAPPLICQSVLWQGTEPQIVPGLLA